MGTAALRILSTVPILLALGGAPAADCAEQIVARSDRGFDDTVQQIQWALGGYGLTTVSALDYQQIRKGREPATARAVMFEVMRREWLNTVLDQDPSLGIALPIRIYIFEGSDSGTRVSYQTGGAAFALHRNEKVRAFGKQLDEKLHALVTQAIRLRPTIE